MKLLDLVFLIYKIIVNTTSIVILRFFHNNVLYSCEQKHVPPTPSLNFQKLPSQGRNTSAWDGSSLLDIMIERLTCRLRFLLSAINYDHTWSERILRVVETLCWEFHYNPTTDSQVMAQNGIPLVAKKWTNQKNDPTISRGWQNCAYTVNFVRFGQQTPELWPKRCPLVAKKWTLVKTNFTRSTSAQCQ